MGFEFMKGKRPQRLRSLWAMDSSWEKSLSLTLKDNLSRMPGSPSQPDLMAATAGHPETGAETRPAPTNEAALLR